MNTKEGCCPLLFLAKKEPREKLRVLRFKIWLRLLADDLHGGHLGTISTIVVDVNLVDTGI